MNVALGGTLFYRVHLVPGFEDHRMPRHEDVTREEIFRLRHTIHLTPGGLFEDIVGTDQVKTNTLHGQAIKDIADCLEVEAVSEDGVIEMRALAVGDEEATLGVEAEAIRRAEPGGIGGHLPAVGGEVQDPAAVRPCRPLLFTTTCLPSTENPHSSM